MIISLWNANESTPSYVTLSLWMLPPLSIVAFNDASVPGRTSGQEVHCAKNLLILTSFVMLWLSVGWRVLVWLCDRGELLAIAPCKMTLTWKCLLRGVELATFVVLWIRCFGRKHKTISRLFRSLDFFCQKILQGD